MTKEEEIAAKLLAAYKRKIKAVDAAQAAEKAWLEKLRRIALRQIAKAWDESPGKLAPGLGHTFLRVGSVTRYVYPEDGIPVFGIWLQTAVFRFSVDNPEWVYKQWGPDSWGHTLHPNKPMGSDTTFCGFISGPSYGVCWQVERYSTTIRGCMAPGLTSTHYIRDGATPEWTLQDWAAAVQREPSDLVTFERDAVLAACKLVERNPGTLTNKPLAYLARDRNQEET